MIDAAQLLTLVIRPTLKRIGLHSRAAEVLLLGTAIHESRLRYLKQIRGPAMGLFQMEPTTHRSLWTHQLRRKKWHDLRDRIAAEAAPRPARVSQLASNLAYATAMARAKYWFKPQPLPAWDDAAGMARYHKQHYNTYLGAADPKKTVRQFRRAVAIVRESP